MKIRLAVITATVLLSSLLFFRPSSDEADIPKGLSVSKPTSGTMQSTQMTQSQTITTSNTTVPETLATEPPATTVPATAATTVPATMASTVPPTTAPTTIKPASTNPKVQAFVQERMNTWTRPIKDAFEEVVGSRTFASSRSGGKRAHAGIDFVAPHGTKVYAITSGTVQRVALYYSSTLAVEVKNDDGSILRYCEISTDLEDGDRVEQGELIGKIMRTDSGTEMLHMEVYYGDGEGMLTQTWNTTYTYLDNPKNFLRRSDLLDPSFLKDLKIS